MRKPGRWWLAVAGAPLVGLTACTAPPTPNIEAQTQRQTHDDCFVPVEEKRRFAAKGLAFVDPPDSLTIQQPTWSALYDDIKSVLGWSNLQSASGHYVYWVRQGKTLSQLALSSQSLAFYELPTTFGADYGLDETIKTFSRWSTCVARTLTDDATVRATSSSFSWNDRRSRLLIHRDRGAFPNAKVSAVYTPIGTPTWYVDLEHAAEQNRPDSDAYEVPLNGDLSLRLFDAEEGVDKDAIDRDVTINFDLKEEFNALSLSWDEAPRGKVFFIRPDVPHTWPRLPADADQRRLALVSFFEPAAGCP